MSKHTPGPWAQEESNNDLIARDLLAALKDALAELETMNYRRYYELERKMRAAIAKAEGSA